MVCLPTPHFDASAIVAASTSHVATLDIASDLNSCAHGKPTGDARHILAVVGVVGRVAHPLHQGRRRVAGAPSVQ